MDLWRRKRARMNKQKIMQKKRGNIEYEFIAYWDNQPRIFKFTANSENISVVTMGIDDGEVFIIIDDNGEQFRVVEMSYEEKANEARQNRIASWDDMSFDELLNEYDRISSGITRQLNPVTPSGDIELRGMLRKRLSNYHKQLEGLL